MECTPLARSGKQTYTTTARTTTSAASAPSSKLRILDAASGVEKEACASGALRDILHEWLPAADAPGVSDGLHNIASARFSLSSVVEYFEHRQEGT